jgi:chitinase
LGSQDVLINTPEKLSGDGTLGWRSGFWFWAENVHAVVPQGFGATINAINGPVECNGKRPDLVQARITRYKSVCQALGVDPGANLSC